MAEDGDSVTTGWECGNCGDPRDDMAVMPPPTNRTPCRNCGSTSLKFSVAVHERVAGAVDRYSWRMRPGVQPVGWEARWRQVQRDVDAVCGRQSHACDAGAIGDATARMYDAFVDAYHLKDYLKAQTSVPGRMIENEITASKTLSLCADIANTDKHAVLDSRKGPPRSGSAPAFRECAAESTADHEGWILDVVIDHNGTTVSGTALLCDVIDEWERLLKGWDLI